MENKNITTISRLLLFVCGLALLIILFTPIWRIDLDAPQYPEGLSLYIFADKLGGNVDIVNGLNHYIGMKTLHADDFVEFSILPKIILFFAAMFMLTGIIGNRKLTNFLCILFILFGLIAMADFYRWEYDYGHNLNPNAAIIVPGMAYQPPLIGFKQLLNFGAWSIPDTGGWIFIGAGAVLLGVVIFEWRRNVKLRLQLSPLTLMAILGLTFCLTSCSTSPKPIRIGKDNCSFCKMTISDNKFGGELITKKGKIFTFDDSHCLLSFLQAKEIAQQEIGDIYFTNYAEPHQLLKAEMTHFLQSPSLKSPMNGNIAAFVNEDGLNKAILKFYGNKITWEEMKK